MVLCRGGNSWRRLTLGADDLANGCDKGILDHDNPMRPDYADLSRQFLPYDPKPDVEATAALSYLGSSGSGALDWDGVLAHGRVVVLGEARSGKTWEFEAEAERQTTKGRPGFFIRLEALTEGLEKALAPDALRRYQSWRRSHGEACFFLDAVEESRLASHHDFEKALRRFAQDVGLALLRTRIILSSRVSEWRQVSDRDLVTRLLPNPPTVERIDQSEPVSATTLQENRKQKPDAPAPALMVVQLAPLEPHQVRTLASKTTARADAFLEAIDISDAWGFARRPKDVLDLLVYWAEHGHLGRRSELLESDAHRKLTEANPQHSPRDPLSYERARAGAEVLAAAAALCRRFAFLLPEEVAHLDESGTALDPRAVLGPAGWRDSEIRALLARPLFDEATFGTVRFHHRDSLDYLAACWLRRLLNAGCPQRSASDLLFSTCYGQPVIIPSRRALAAWLAAWEARIRKRVMDVDADSLLRHGDPALIPLAERSELLRRIVSQTSVRRFEDPTQLRRLAHPHLVPTIRSLLQDDRVATDVKLMLLMVVREGRLTEAGKVALVIAGDSSQANELRNFAIMALRDFGDLRRLRALADRLIDGSPLPGRLAPILASALYPDVIDEERLRLLLRSATGGVHDYVYRTIATTIRERIPFNRLVPALRSFGQLLTEAAGDQRESGRMSRVRVLMGPFLAALQRILSDATPDQIDTEIVADAIYLVETLPHAAGHGVDKGETQSLLLNHTAVRRTLFRRKVQRLMSRGDEPRMASSFLWRWALWKLVAEDIPWLLQEVEHPPDGMDRRYAFVVTTDLWHASGRPFRLKLRISALKKRFPELRQIYRNNVNTAFGRWSWRIIHASRRLYRDPPRFYRFRHYLRDLGAVARVRWQALVRLDRVYQGKDWWRLYNLLIVGREHYSGNQFEDQPISGIATHHGRLIGWVARQGVKAFWRTWRPPLPGHELLTNYYPCTVALIGLKTDLEDGLRFDTLSTEDAETAAYYALHEMNGFPSWLPALIAAHGDVVRSVFRQQLEAEFTLPATVEHPHGLLYDLTYGDEVVARLCGNHVASLLTAGEPPNPRVLSHAIEALGKVADRQTLASLAPSRQAAAAAAGDVERQLIWLVVWISTDAAAALDAVEAIIDAAPTAGDDFIMRLASRLLGREGGGMGLRMPDVFSPGVMERLVPLLYRHVRPDEDIEHEGAYRPSPRDHAQRLRDGIVNRLVETHGREAYEVMLRLSQRADLPRHVRDWLRYGGDEAAKRDADPAAWSPEDVAQFAACYERRPASADDLFQLALYRLEVIREQAEEGDFSARDLFKDDDHESKLQKWLAGKLDDLRRDLYQVARETEVYDDKKPDIRLFAAGIDGVTIEAKWAHKWSYNELRTDALEQQLVGQYMRTNRSRHGILVLVNLVRTRTWLPTGEPPINFATLCARLDREAKELVKSRGNGEQLAVLGMGLA